jgi:hypothetical protein
MFSGGTKDEFGGTKTVNIFRHDAEVALIIGLCASLSTVVLVQGGGFSSNVVMLNSRNWRKEVEDSGHAVFINVW